MFLLKSIKQVRLKQRKLPQICLLPLRLLLVLSPWLQSAYQNGSCKIVDVNEYKSIHKISEFPLLKTS